MGYFKTVDKKKSPSLEHMLVWTQKHKVSKWDGSEDHQDMYVFL